jgi:hypothetical protein
MLYFIVLSSKPAYLPVSVRLSKFHTSSLNDTFSRLNRVMPFTPAAHVLPWEKHLQALWFWEKEHQTRCGSSSAVRPVWRSGRPKAFSLDSLGFGCLDCLSVRMLAQQCQALLEYLDDRASGRCANVWRSSDKRLLAYDFQ